MKSELLGVHIWPLSKYTDGRGWLMELFREDALEDEHLPAMSYVSLTLPGISRGPHVHSKQSDLFCFFSGEFELHLWVLHAPVIHELFIVGENEPVAVIVPPGIVHGYKNIGNTPALVFNAPNQLYGGMGKKYPIDELRYEDSTLYQM